MKTPLAKYLADYLEYEEDLRDGMGLNQEDMQEVMEQALDAYESTQQVKIKIEDVKPMYKVVVMNDRAHVYEVYASSEEEARKEVGSGNHEPVNSKNVQWEVVNIEKMEE